MYVLLTIFALAIVVCWWHVQRSPERHRQDGGVERKP